MVVEMDYSKPMDVWPPLPSLQFQIGSVVAYWIILFVIQRIMKNREAFELRTFSAIHNLIMTIVSLALAIGIGKHIYITYRDYGLLATYCGVNNDHDDKLGFWVNWFYLSKFYEFVDTFILALRKRKLGKLHVIHHSITGLVSWVAMDSQIIMGWITAFNNSLIHVFMYWYYFKLTIGQDVWWKRFLTTGQILQFIIDTTTSWPFLYLWYIGQPCRGTINAWLIANCAGFLLLFLFIEFYVQTYTRKQQAKKKET